MIKCTTLCHLFPCLKPKYPKLISSDMIFSETQLKKKNYLNIMNTYRFL